MVPGDAEAQRLHAAEVGDLVLKRLEDDAGPGVIAREQVRQLAQVVGPSLPVHPGQIHAIGDGEVVERSQQVGLQRVPQPQLGCGPPLEEGAHVEPIAAFGGSGEPEQLPWRQVIEDAPVGARLGVVELVDHDDVVGVRRQVGDAVCRQGLHGCEHMVPTFGPMPVH